MVDLSSLASTLEAIFIRARPKVLRSIAVSMMKILRSRSYRSGVVANLTDLNPVRN